MPETFPTPKLVIFDCDGVLVDSEPVSNQCMVENLARHGLQLSLQQAMSHFVGGTMTGVMTKARAMGADLPDDWLTEINDEIFERLRRGVEIIPGVLTLLDLLDAHGIAFCVASNGSRKKMSITLGQVGLWPRFENVMFSAHALGVAKPDPGLFLAAASHFGVQARDCLVVEDGGSGVTAATRAGMRCLGYISDTDTEVLSVLGAEPFRNMSEVSDLIGL